jgi:hypothetical protein
MQTLYIESLIFGAFLILNGEFSCLLTLIFKQNAKLSANITDTKFGDPLKPRRNWVFMERLALLTGIPALETACASTFALFRCMSWLTRLETRFLKKNLILYERKTAYNAWPAKCSALLKQ